jgi:hypothetical protein
VYELAFHPDVAKDLKTWIKVRGNASWTGLNGWWISL